MIALGLVLLIVGWIIGMQLLVTLGIILIVVGIIFLVLGAIGHPVLGRSRWY